MKIELSPSSNLNRKLLLRFDRFVSADEFIVTIGGRNVEMQPQDTRWLVFLGGIKHEEATRLQVEITLHKAVKPVRWLDVLIRDSKV